MISDFRCNVQIATSVSSQDAAPALFGIAVATQGWAAAMERAARAAHRRKTWTGRHVHLHDEGDDPRLARSAAKRVATVSQVSKQAFGIASAAHGQTHRTATARKSSSPSGRLAAGSRPAQSRTAR